MRSALIVFALLVTPSFATAQSGVQWTRDRDATLVSKDVNSERWAITYRLSDGRVTGNVYRSDGGQPAFLDCNRTSITGTEATFDCYGADACAEAPCLSSQYRLIEAGISLPISFFFPPGDSPGDGDASAEDLIGTWRFTVGNGDDQEEFIYRFDRLDDDGRTAFGTEEGSGDEIVASDEGDEFVMFEREDVNCRRYVFDFIGFNWLEGTRAFTVRVPFSNECDTFSVGGDSAFFAQRIG